MLVKFGNGYFITFSTHKLESDRAGAQELPLSEDAENSWAWQCAVKITPLITIKQLGLGWKLWVAVKHFGGGGGGGPRSKTRHAQEQNISAQ